MSDSSNQWTAQAERSGRDKDSFRVPIPFLRRLLELTRVSREIPGAATLQGHPGAPVWQESLRSIASSNGLNCRSVIWSVREAVGAAQQTTPLVSIRNRPDGHCEWFAVVGRKRKQALLVTADGSTRRMKIEAIAEWLGQDSTDEPRSWSVVASAFPASISSFESSYDSKGEPAKHPFYRLVDLLRPDHADLWAFLLFASFIGGLTLATPIAVQQLVNSIAFGGLVQPVIVLAVLLFGVLGFSAVLSGVQAFVAELIQRRIFVRVVLDVSERLPRVQPQAFDRVHGPEVVNRVFDIVTVQKVGSILLLEGTSVLLQTIVGLAVLSFYHPLMLAFSGALIAGIIAVVVVMGRGAVRTAIAESKAKYEVVQWLEELARHTGAFRAAPQRGYARVRTDGLATRYVNARRTHYRIVLRQFGSALALQVLASSALLALGGMLVVQGQLTLGQLVASELIITMIVAAVAKLGKQLESFYDLLAAMDKLAAVVDLPIERASGGSFEPHPGPAQIDLAGVNFSHGSTPVLRDFDFSISPGDRIAVQGAMGTGKTTLFELLVGLREPARGSISYDGRDYRDIRLEELREAVALVSEFEIFDGTVLENLQMGRHEFEHAEVLAALEAVGLLEEIRTLPSGLETRLATDGRPLSHVQVARLMLARALLGRPRLLLLDRSLDHLDAEARRRVCDLIFDAEAPWTLLVVTEHSDVAERCDRTLTLGAAEVWNDAANKAAHRSYAEPPEIAPPSGGIGR